MATLTLQSSHTTVTHAPSGSNVRALSAFGPNVTGKFSSSSFSTSVTGVTAIITDITIGTYPVSDDLAAPFLFDFSTFTTPYYLKTSTAYGLSAKVASCYVGVQNVAITVTLSSQFLSGSNGSTFSLDSSARTWTFNYNITAVNVPVGNQPCSERVRKLYALGYI